MSHARAPMTVQLPSAHQQAVQEHISTPIDGGATWVASGNFINLVPATYDIRIRDAVNTSCSVILYPNLVITEPVLLGMTSTGDILLDCFGDTDGTGTFYASGGTMPYTFHVIIKYHRCNTCSSRIQLADLLQCRCRDNNSCCH